MYLLEKAVVGRRKAAVARVFIKEGNGTITINKRDLTNYFPSSILQYVVKQPLATLGVVEKYDILVNLNGGGYKGQAEALRLAIARALVALNPEDKAILRREGFMTRDPVLLSVRNRVVPKLVNASNSANVNLFVSSGRQVKERLVSKLPRLGSLLDVAA